MKKRIFLFGLFVLFVLASCSKEPTTFEELLQAGETAFVKNQFPQARSYLTKAAALQSSNKRALYLLGLSYGKDYLLDSAFLYLKRADLLYPKDREINKELYRIAPDIKEWQATISAIAVLIKTGDAPEKYYPELITLNSADSNFASAFYYSKKLKEADPENPSHYLQAASYAHLVESTDVAIAILDSAVTKFGSREEFLSNKAVYLIAKRDFEGAEKIFRSLVSSSTNKLVYQSNLANALASQSSRRKKEEALKLYMSLRDKSAQALGVDSLIAQVKKELEQK